MVEEARAAQAALFGNSWPLLQQVNVPTATALVRDPRQLAVWADLLQVEAQATRAMGDEKRASYLESRAEEIATAAVRTAPTQ